MNQPELGNKVAELRQQKGLTQEHLAEKCEVNPRTIQRIESGEVDPRSYTLQCLSRELEFDFLREQAKSDDLWLVVLHLSSVIPVLIVPLLLWSWKRNQNSKIDQQGRDVLNFQVTMLLLLFLGGFLLMLLPVALPIVGSVIGDAGIHWGMFEFILICATTPMILIGLFCTFQGVANAVRALADRPIRYLLSIPFIK